MLPEGTSDPIRVNLDHMSRFAAAALLARCALDEVGALRRILIRVASSATVEPPTATDLELVIGVALIGDIAEDALRIMSGGVA